MNKKEIWEKFHKEEYNRFNLRGWPLRKLFVNYKNILRKSNIILNVGCGGGSALNYLISVKDVGDY